MGDVQSNASPHALQYEHWVRLHARDLYRFAYRLCGSHMTAEDLVGETFSEAWKSITKLREPEKARAWLFQILRHRYARWVERAKKTRHVERLSDDPDAHPASRICDPANRVADQDAIQLGLNQLSEDIRLTFLMAFTENLTCREVAAELGIPLGTVLSRLNSARQKLRVVLHEFKPSDKGQVSTKVSQ